MFFVMGAQTWRRIVWIAALSGTAGVLAFVSAWTPPETASDGARWGSDGVPVMATVTAPEDAALSTATPVLVPSDAQADPGRAAPAAQEPSGESIVERGTLRLGTFVTYRIERERARSARIEMLEEMLQEDGAAADGVREELLRLVRQGEKEAQAEGLLRTEGMREAVVVLSGTGASVVVSDVLDQSGAARVGELVARVTQTPKEQITIVDGGA